MYGDQGPLEGTVFAHGPKDVLGYRSNGAPIYPIAGGSEPTLDNPQDGGNPAWGEFLGVVPEEYHEQVRPILEKWDKGVQDQFQKVHSEYEPWKDIIKSEYDPDTIKMATEMLGMLQQDPRSLYDSLGQHFGFTAEEVEELEQQAEENPEQGQGDFWDDPRIQELNRNQQVMAGLLQAQHQADLEKKEEAALERELEALKADVGDFDEDDLIRRMLTNDKLDVRGAYDQQQKHFDTIRNARPKPPRLVGGGSGSIPNGNVDVTKLSDKDRKALVVQTLLAARGEQT